MTQAFREEAEKTLMQLKTAADNAWYWDHDKIERRSEKREKPEAKLFREAVAVIEYYLDSAWGKA